MVLKEQITIKSQVLSYGDRGLFIYLMFIWNGHGNYIGQQMH